MQLFGVDLTRGLCSPINGRMLGPETGLQTGCDTMLFGEQKGQDVHVEHTIFIALTEARVHPGMLDYITIKCE